MMADAALIFAIITDFDVRIVCHLSMSAWRCRRRRALRRRRHADCPSASAAAAERAAQAPAASAVTRCLRCFYFSLKRASDSFELADAERAV